MVELGYDRFGRLLQDGLLAYEFDENSNTTKITYPDGSSALYTYDFADRPETLSLDDGEVDPFVLFDIVTAATYHPLGPLASLTLGNGLTETRDVTERYFPDRVKVEDPGTSTLFEWDYTDWDLEGNILAIDDALNAANNRSYTYQDYQYFLEYASGPWPGALSWEFDKIGNRQTETRGANTDIYTYLGNGGGNTPRLDEIALGATSGTKAFTFGAAGHQELVDLGANDVDMEWDNEGRMEQVSRTAGESVDFLYDGRGFLMRSTTTPVIPRRVGTAIFADGFESGDPCAWSAVAGWAGECPKPVVVEPIYDSGGVLQGVTRSMGGDSWVLYFGDRPIAMVNNGALLWLTTDHLGTPAFACDSSGTEVWSGGFEPYGEDYQAGTSAGAQENEIFLRLPGQWWDESWEDASLGAEGYHNVNRWYELGIGRYTREDPLGLYSRPDPNVHSLAAPPPENIFGYGKQRPTRYVDHLGLQSEDGEVEPTEPSEECDFSRYNLGSTSCCRMNGVTEKLCRSVVDFACNRVPVRCCENEKLACKSCIDLTCDDAKEKMAGCMAYWIRCIGGLAKADCAKPKDSSK